MALHEFIPNETIDREQGEKILGWVKSGIDQLAKARGRTERLNKRDQEVMLNNPPQILQDLVKYCQLLPEQRPESFENLKKLLEASLPEGKELAEQAAFIAAAAKVLESQGFKCQLPPLRLTGRHEIALSVDLMSPDGDAPLGSRELLIRVAYGLPVSQVPQDAKIMFTYPEEAFDKLIRPDVLDLPVGSQTTDRTMRQRPRSNTDDYKRERKEIAEWRKTVNKSWESLYQAANEEAARLRCSVEEIDTALICLPDLQLYPFLINPDTGEGVEFYDEQAGKTRNNLDELLDQGMVMNNYRPIEVPGQEKAA